MGTEKYKILLVDDEVDIAELCADAFQMEGFQVTTAYRVDEALDKMAVDDFDVIISDQNMPGKNGGELLKNVKESHSTALFYFTTGSVLTAENEVLEMGATGLFTKPYNVEDLITAVKIKLGV